MRRFVQLALVLVLACLCSLARADGVADEAEVNFRLGAERYQAGDYRSALAYFLASNRLAPNRNVRFNIARTFQRLSQFPEAYRWCQAALQGEVEPELRAQLEETLRTIEREVAIIDVSTTPAGATIYVDRQDLGSLANSPARIAVPEGEHRILVQLEGYEPTASPPVMMKRGTITPVSLSLQRIAGTVELSSNGPAEVHVDWADAPVACTTPCVLELAPGLHTLFFRRAHHRVAAATARVIAGTRQRVHVDTVPLVGSILVTTDERDALIEVDGVAMGFTPTVVRNVAVGKRHVRVSLRGFTPIEHDVQVLESEQVDLRDLPLVPTREVTAASRLTESIDDAPASVSVVSAQEIEAFRYPTIYEALRGQRGVALSYDGAYSGITLRGLGQPGDYSNRLLVLSDGATLNDNILWQSYVGYDGRVDLGDVERIELVRGPGSVLYGTGAVSGVVNLIPRGMPRRPTAEARITASDTRTARARAAGGIPLGKHGGLTLSAAGAHADGETIQLPTSPAPTRVSGVNRFDAATGNARLEYRALTLQAFFTTREQQVPQGAYGALIGQGKNQLLDQRGLLEARFEPELTKNVRLYTRAFGNFYDYHAEQTTPGSAPGQSAFLDERYRGLWLGAEARVVARLAQALRVSAGAEMQVSTRASLDGISREALATRRYLDENEPYRIYAGYGLLEWYAARSLTVSVGARADAWSTFGATVNPRLAVLVKPSERDVIKLMGGRAFRAPSIYELRYNDAGQTQKPSDYAGNKLGPELVWSGEIELTHKLDDGWSMLGAAHGQYAEDLIEQASTDASDPSAPVYYRNGGSSVYTVGGDLELRREMRAGFLFAASYGYLRARYLNASAGSGDARLPNVPSHYGQVRAIAPLGAGLKLAARTTLEAPRRIDASRRAETSLAAIADVVLSGQLASAGFDYAVGLYNLFDFRYALPTDPTFVTRTIPQPGRTLLFSLGIRR